ncbi:uncharacterized protein LOC125371741 [Haliotis rufescens]|uniref:uncharacterized protein LOC125371741 n=1 Tax=Haliotis rufescens TaxID=6454 RepID=UPI00201F706D|nr:uncharacterized protein LOC125371741 [Haliotis rufescens]
MKTTASVSTLLVMFVNAVAAAQLNTAIKNNYADPYGLNIIGHWSAKVELKGCKNIQFGLWGPTKSTSNGYNIDLNKDTGGQYFSAVRKICSGCPGTPESQVNQGGSFFTCDSTFHPYWVSWDQCTIRMGKGTVIGGQQIISWSDADIIEVKYISVGASDGSNVVSMRFDQTTNNATVDTVQNCEELTCAAQSRPAVSSGFLPFVFHMSGVGKMINNADHVIFQETGMTTKECNYKCLCTTACIGFSISTTGTCKLTDKCVPSLAYEAGSNVYTLQSFGSPLVSTDYVMSVGGDVYDYFVG